MSHEHSGPMDPTPMRPMDAMDGVPDAGAMHGEHGPPAHHPTHAKHGTHGAHEPGGSGPGPQPGAGELALAPDAVGVWLDGLVRVMRLPKREADEIREELDSHVRERVRDLMLIGESEPRAIHHAISELGDAAMLAQRYRTARGNSQRRWIMTAATLAIASGALVLSTLTFTSPASGPGGQAAEQSSHQTAPETTRQTDGDQLDKVLATTVELEEEATYHEFFDMIREAAGGSIVDGAVFEDAGIELAEPMGVDTDGMSIGMVLDLLNRRQFSEHIVLRPTDIGVEITTRHELDRIETTLVSYDIEPLLDEGVDLDALTSLITNFVEPDLWMQNGGDTATYQIVGDRLFVEGPPRFLPRIEWMLDQLGSRPGPDAPAGAIREFIRRDREDAAAAPTTAPTTAESHLAIVLAEQMRQIGVLMVNYAAEHDRLPTRPSDLRHMTGDYDLFLAPLARIAGERYDLTPDERWNWTDRNASFKMLPGELFQTDSPILVEREPLIRGHRVVCFGDAHVELVKAEGLKGAARPEAEGARAAERTQVVHVSGLVSRPRTSAQLDRSFTLRRLLASAGDTLGDASEILIWRGETTNQAIAHTIDADRLADSGDDYALLPGDRVDVR